jgi:hypothetical protein
VPLAPPTSWLQDGRGGNDDASDELALSLTISSSRTGSFNRGSRPSLDPGACPPGVALGGSEQRRLNMWFKSAVYIQPVAFTFETVRRTLANGRADGPRRKVDLSMAAVGGDQLPTTY